MGFVMVWELWNVWFHLKDQFLSAAFVDVKSAFDTVHMPTLINHLSILDVSQKLGYFVQSLFL